MPEVPFVLEEGEKRLVAVLQRPMQLLYRYRKSETVNFPCFDEGKTK